MYDEFERAVTGKTPRRGLSPLGLIAVCASALLLVAGAGVGYGLFRITSRVRQMAREVSASTAIATTRAVSHLRGDASLVAMDPEAGLAFLRGLDSGDPSRALMQKIVGSSFDLSHGLQVPSRGSQDTDVASATVHSGDGDVHIDLNRRDNGGSLVVDSRDGRVRFDLVKSSRGGTLTIRSDDGDARIDFVRGDDGAQISLYSDEGNVVLSVGSSSRDAPAWVPRPDGMPRTDQPVFALTTTDAALGAVAWKADASPDEIVSAYRDVLEKEGYDVQAEHSHRGSDGEDASLWARQDEDGHMVFLLVRQMDGRTRVVLGYGEGDAAGR